MELYIKDSGPDFFEVVDRDHRGILFRFEDIKIDVTKDGMIEVISVNSVTAVDGVQMPDEEWADEHAQKILQELVSSLY